MYDLNLKLVPCGVWFVLFVVEVLCNFGWA